MKKYLMKYNMVTVNVLSFALMLICTIFMAFIFAFVDFDISFDFFETVTKSEISIIFILFVFFLIVFIYLCLHELIHGITYIATGANRSDIKYGIALENGILFCKCGGYVNKKCILTSVIMPFIVLGVITTIISVIFKLPLLLMLSVFNITGCSGDLMMFIWFSKRGNNFKFREVGDSTAFIIETEEDLESMKSICCKVDKVLDKDIEDDKFINKVNISTISKLFLVFLLVLFIVGSLACLLIR